MDPLKYFNNLVMIKNLQIPEALEKTLLKFKRNRKYKLTLKNLYNSLEVE